MADISIVIDSWQLILGFIGFIIAILSATVAICAFIYTLRERIKVLEVKLERQEKELDKFTNLFQDAGFNIFVEKAKGMKTK